MTTSCRGRTDWDAAMAIVKVVLMRSVFGRISLRAHDRGSIRRHILPACRLFCACGIYSGHWWIALATKLLRERMCRRRRFEINAHCLENYLKLVASIKIDAHFDLLWLDPLGGKTSGLYSAPALICVESNRPAVLKFFHHGSCGQRVLGAGTFCLRTATGLGRSLQLEKYGYT